MRQSEALFDIFESDQIYRGEASEAKLKFDDVILGWFGPLSHPTRQINLALYPPSESTSATLLL